MRVSDSVETNDRTESEELLLEDRERTARLISTIKHEKMRVNKHPENNHLGQILMSSLIDRKQYHMQIWPCD